VDPPRWPATQRKEKLYRNRPLIFHRELSFRKVKCNGRPAASLSLSLSSSRRVRIVQATPNPTFRIYLPTYLPTDAKVLTSHERSETAGTRDAEEEEEEEEKADDDDNDDDDDDEDDEDEDDERRQEATSDETRRESGRTTRETRNTTETVCTAPRAPETVLTNSPGVYTHSLVSTRARHNGDYEPHIGGDDTSRTHTGPFAARNRGRRIVRLYPAIGGMRSETERAVGQAVERDRAAPPRLQRIRSVDGGPSSGLAGFPKGLFAPSVLCIMYVRHGASASTCTSLQLPSHFPARATMGLFKSKRTPERGVAFKILALGVGFIF